MLVAVSLLIFETLLTFSKIQMSKVSNESKLQFRVIMAGMLVRYRNFSFIDKNYF